MCNPALLHHKLRYMRAHIGVPEASSRNYCNGSWNRYSASITSSTDVRKANMDRSCQKKEEGMRTEKLRVKEKLPQPEGAPALFFPSPFPSSPSTPSLFPTPLPPSPHDLPLCTCSLVVCVDTALLRWTRRHKPVSHLQLNELSFTCHSKFFLEPNI